MDDRGVLRGIVSRFEFLRVFRPDTRRWLSGLFALWAERVDEIMNRGIDSVEPGASVVTAVDLMIATGRRSLPVVERRPIGPVLVGMVSRTDLLHHHGQKAVRLLAAPHGRGEGGSEPGGEAPVRNVMTPAVFCVHAHTPAAKVVDKMLALNVRRLFVVDDEGVLVGVVSAFDVLRGLDRPFRAAA